MSEVIYGNIVKSFAYLNILIELSKGRRITGYDVLVNVKGFGLDVSAGTVYHQLGMLEKAGIVRGEQHESRSKTVYEMTERGVKLFEEFKEKWMKPLEYVYRNLHP